MGVVKLKEFNLPEVYVVDLDESIKFYTEVLGMKIERNLFDGVLLRATPDCIVYMEGGRNPHGVDPATTACTCMCFSTSEGLRESYDKLVDAGVSIVTHYTEFSEYFHMFRIADPSGNVIEFAGRP